jgi:hypothetical protein
MNSRHETRQWLRKPAGPWDHLTPANRQRLQVILSVQVPEVFAAARVIEERTGQTTEIGRNNLADVLSHLGVLCAATHLDATGQASQLSKMEEHLRRALIEHPEEVARQRIVETRDLWDSYQQDVVPLRKARKLQGGVRDQELEDLRRRIATCMEHARQQKPEESTWDESLSIAAEMTEAAHLSEELAEKLHQTIGAARGQSAEHERHKQTIRVAVIGVVSAGVVGLAAVGGTLWAASGDDDTKTVTFVQPTTAARAPAPKPAP